MSEHKLSETDWKRWVHLSERARKRLEESVLDQAAKMARGGGSPGERYAKLSKLLAQTDDVIATVFDDQKRTRAVLQIVAALDEGVVTRAELDDFSDESLAAIDAERASR